MEEEKKSLFDELYGVNVNGRTEDKNGLTYLSWTFAVAEMMKRCPDMAYEIKRFDGKPYLYDENLGYMVMTEVTVQGQTKEMWLPVMDGANNAMKAVPYEVTTRKGTNTVKPATMMDINKTIMRCLTKNLAMFGLGLYIYAGEDLPEEEAEAIKAQSELEKIVTREEHHAMYDLAKAKYGEEAWKTGLVEVLKRFGYTDNTGVKRKDYDGIMAELAVA